MNKRIKELREVLGMTQDEFAQTINLKRNSLSLIELGKRNPSDRTISDICKKHNVSEKWLRSGSGSMFSSKPKGIIQQLADEYSLNSDDLALLLNYLRLEKNERAVVASYVQNVAEDMKRQTPIDAYNQRDVKPFEEMTPGEIADAVTEAREQEKGEVEWSGQSSSTA